ncbi:MAG TPA: UvrD-helicase domain-containing protein, partial [Chroococcales cyanobacterium]
MAGLTEQQERAVTTIDMDVLVSAGAGSGKTHVLVERYIEVLRRIPEASVGGIVAVTFTRKAASEMKSRLKSRIREVLSQAGDDERERWQAAYSQIDGARIGTIHSLCETIVKSFPVEAGIDPQVEVLDDLAQAELLEQCIDQSFRDVIAEQADSHQLLLQVQLPELRDWIGQALRASTQFKESLLVLDLSCLESWKKQVRTFILQMQRSLLSNLLVMDKGAWPSALSYLENNSWPDESNQLEIDRKGMVMLARAVHSPRSENKIADPECLPPDERWQLLAQMGEIVTRSGGNGDQAKAIRAQLKVLREMARACRTRVPDDVGAADEQAFSILSHFVDLARRSLNYYEQKKHDELMLDFNDLIELAVRALEAPGKSVRSSYTENIHAILVDEFQDTNKLQSKLIRLLVGEKTRLFLIGDDKQSIYKFQGADVAMFNEWKDQFSRADAATILSLSKSFRSHPAVVNFINAAFSQLMAPDSDSFQEGKQNYKATFEELTAARADSTGALQLDAEETSEAALEKLAASRVQIKLFETI